MRKQASLRTTSVVTLTAALCLTLTTAAPAALVSYYKLDGNANATVGANGTLSGAGGAQTSGPVATTDRNGNAGGALLFDGTDDYVNIGATDDDVTTAISVSAWARVVDLNGDYAIGSNRQSSGSQRQFLIWMDFEGAAEGYRGSSNSATTSDAADNAIANQWQHVVMTYGSGGSTLLYIDGKLDETQIAGVALTAEVDNLVIGAQSEGAGGTSLSKFMNGAIDDFGIFDETIGPAKVSAIHGLSVFSGIDLDDAAIDAAVALTTPGEKITGVGAGNHTWAYVTNLTGTTGDIGGSVAGGDAYIVLNGSTGAGLAFVAVPTPSAGLMTLAGVAGLLVRRRR